MANFIGSRNYVLVSGTDYTPGAGTIPLESSWIMGIHVLDSISTDVVITHHTGFVSTLPATALAAGAVYYYSVKEILLDPADAGKILGLSPGYKSLLF